MTELCKSPRVMLPYNKAECIDSASEGFLEGNKETTPEISFVIELPPAFFPVSSGEFPHMIRLIGRVSTHFLAASRFLSTLTSFSVNKTYVTPQKSFVTVSFPYTRWDNSPICTNTWQSTRFDYWRAIRMLVYYALSFPIFIFIAIPIVYTY